MRNNLICTVGTSLLQPNLRGLPTEQSYETWLNRQPEGDRPHLHPDLIRNVGVAFAQQDWRQTASRLQELPGSVRLCGAEINSITDLIERGYIRDQCRLFFCHSDTPEGDQVANILRHYYLLRDYPVELSSIADLQDREPKRFRTRGLRNLAKDICRIVREYGVTQCAINATGGYKAQIAIGVLIGQALGLPVYYKHELFSEIIAFPPMPISLDHDLWMENSGLLTALDRQDDVKWADVEEDWDERLETLVERIEIDGDTYLDLSPTGQIFHETFKGRFESERDQVLPPDVPASQKNTPLSDHNWGNARGVILSWMQRITKECSYVKGCRTCYWNPNLTKTSLFRLKGEEIEGWFSQGNWTVKFIVDTSAQTAGQRAACVADLNHRMMPKR